MGTGSKDATAQGSAKREKSMRSVEASEDAVWNAYEH